jgi:hypothetical protein
MDPSSKIVLALATRVIIGCETLRIHDRILLCQISDPNLWPRSPHSYTPGSCYPYCSLTHWVPFPFTPAVLGLRWRHSSPLFPSNGCCAVACLYSCYMVKRLPVWTLCSSYGHWPLLCRVLSHAVKVASVLPGSVGRRAGVSSAASESISDSRSSQRYSRCVFLSHNKHTAFLLQTLSANHLQAINCCLLGE